MKMSIAGCQHANYGKVPKRGPVHEPIPESEARGYRLNRNCLRYRILVADDEPAIRQLNFEMLTDEGYEVTDVADGIKAWKALERERYDLLITDNLMPNMSGVELLEKLHAARRFVPVILATGTMPALQVQCQPWFQMATMVLKPYALEALLEAVKKSLQMRSDVCFTG